MTDHSKVVSKDIIKLIETCISEGTGYVNLDTFRRNKDTTVKRKKDVYIDHNMRIFSKEKPLFDRYSEVLSSTSSKSCLSMQNKDLNSDIDSNVVKSGFKTLSEIASNMYLQLPTTIISNFMKSEAVLDVKTSSASSNEDINRDSWFMIDMFKIINEMFVEPTKCTKPGRSTKSNNSRKSSNKSEKQTNQDKSESKTIPSATRAEVWRKWCGDVMDGTCFCCDNEIVYEEWHCGHIKARAKGGGIEPENLRPTCKKCNLGMGTMHMYEYIIMNRMTGVKHLSASDPEVGLYIKAVEATIRTGEKINWLQQNKHMSKTKADEYRRKIISKRAHTVQRVEVMEEVSKIYEKFNVTKPHN